MSDFERGIGRLLLVVTYVAVTLLVVGVGLMAVNGISPLDGGPTLAIGTIPEDILALTPSGFLWLGLLVMIATPLTRVVGMAIAFARNGDRMLVMVAVGILVVIATGIVVAIGGAPATAVRT